MSLPKGEDFETWKKIDTIFLKNEFEKSTSFYTNFKLDGDLNPLWLRS